jgi:hypothetical protein
MCKATSPGSREPPNHRGAAVYALVRLSDTHGAERPHRVAEILIGLSVIGAADPLAR